MIRLIALAVLVFALGSCMGLGNAAPVVKVGLIAPFEGQGRPLGYAILPQVQEAIAQANAGGQLGQFRVSLMALNDDAYGPEAAAQARVLALDPDVVIVLGPWTTATLEATIPILESQQLAAIGGAPADTAAIIASVCPPVEEVANSLLDRARKEVGSNPESIDIVIAGPENSLSRALMAGAPADVRRLSDSSSLQTVEVSTVVIHTGDAEAAADDMAKWLEAGWDGKLIGGPDLAQPWFGDLAGKDGEDVLALACGADPGRAGQPIEQEARTAVNSALASIHAAIATTGQPSRTAVANALIQTPPEQRSQWYRFTLLGWSPDGESLTQ